jgi:hypothetical protein
MLLVHKIALDPISSRGPILLALLVRPALSGIGRSPSGKGNATHTSSTRAELPIKLAPGRTAPLDVLHLRGGQRLFTGAMMTDVAADAVVCR